MQKRSLRHGSISKNDNVKNPEVLKQMYSNTIAQTSQGMESNVSSSPTGLAEENLLPILPEQASSKPAHSDLTPEQTNASSEQAEVEQEGSCEPFAAAGQEIDLDDAQQALDSQKGTVPRSIRNRNGEKVKCTSNWNSYVKVIKQNAEHFSERSNLQNAGRHGAPKQTKPASNIVYVDRDVTVREKRALAKAKQRAELESGAKNKRDD